MLSDKLMILMIIEYVILMLICLFEHRWPQGVYWLGAALIVSAVKWMK